MDILKQALAIPDLEGSKKILCIQPHPDDNEVGAGATITKLIEKGCEIYYATVTDGRMGSNDISMLPEELVKIRRKEQQAAADFLGVKKVYQLGFRDNIPEDVSEIAAKIVDVIRKVKPDMVMTTDPWLPYECHPDHRKTGLAAAEAMMFSGNARYPYSDRDFVYPVWNVSAIAFYNTAYPNTFIDVTGYMDKKLSAMAFHKSQFDRELMELYSMYFPDKARQYAEGKNFEMAEAFKVLSGIHLHCFVDAIRI